MEKRLGTISIILDPRVTSVATVNALISEFGDDVVGRLGLPFRDRGVCIVTLVTESTVERTSALTGKLGKLPGVQVRSLTARARSGEVSNGDSTRQ